MARCVNRLARITIQAANSDDPIAPDPDICLHTRLASAINNRSVPDHDVVAHA